MDDVSEDVSKRPALHLDDKKSPHATEDERKHPPAISFDDKNQDATTHKDYTTSVNIGDENGLNFAPQCNSFVLQGKQIVTRSRRKSESTILATLSSFH